MRPIMPRASTTASPGLTLLARAGVQDHGLQERPVGAADHLRQDRMDIGIGHGMQQQLIALAPGPASPRRHSPLPQPRILFLELQIFLIDR